MTPQANLIGHTENMVESPASDLTLGQYLRCERTKRSISLEEMQKKTSIHLKVLHAMENDDPTNLPAPFFVKNFIKFYTETLGLDPQYALALYDNSTADVSPAPERLPTEPLAEPLPTFSAKKIFSRLAIAILLLGGGFVAWRNYQAISTPTVDAPTEKASPERPVPAEAPLSNQLLTPTQAINEDPAPTVGSVQEEDAAAVQFELAVTCSDLTWMRIEIDDRPAREAFFPAGSSLSWNANEKISLLIGNTDGVVMTLNGEPAVAATTGGKVGRLQLP